MSQGHDSHPYMSKSQLADYLASLRNNQNNGQPRYKGQQSSEESSDGHGSTPLVRALKERYGSGNTTAGHMDVGMSKGRESPTKRALPPVPGKSENSTSWKVGQRNSQDAKRDDKKREELQERSPSPNKQVDFWTTAVVRPLPAAPKSGSNKPDPRDELRMPLENLSIGSSKSTPPSINAPSVASVPRVSAPSINAPSINVPSSSSPSDIVDNEPAKSWPNVHVRSRSSSALLCAVCNKSISGRIVTAVGARFHPDCFRCDKCRTELVFLALRQADHRNMSLFMNGMAKFIVISIIMSCSHHDVNIAIHQSKMKSSLPWAINIIQVPPNTFLQTHRRSLLLCWMWRCMLSSQLN
jgi:hypothetical protein